jgi:hypothetical protein
MSLGEQIAVLDGLAALNPNDGRTGQRRARVDQYGRPLMRGVMTRRDVIDPSDGANYGGGSSYAERLPLLPSSIGLAQLPPQVVVGAAAPFVAPWLFGRRRGLGNIPGVLPTRHHVVDYSQGANYSGGSSYAERLPLLPSNAGLVGLATALIQGGYGRAGLGASFIEGGYGRAGLGQTMSAVDEDLAAASEAVETARQLDPTDGRTGQFRSRVDEYGNAVIPGVLDRSNVLDPSEGANYGGGSDYYPGSPLLPSSVGLAELQTHDALDGLSISLPVSRATVNAIKSKAMGMAKRLNNMTPPQKAVAKRQLNLLGRQLFAVRSVRRQAAQAAGIPVARVPRNRYAVRLPQWAQ